MSIFLLGLIICSKCNSTNAQQSLIQDCKPVYLAVRFPNFQKKDNWFVAVFSHYYNTSCASNTNYDLPFEKVSPVNKNGILKFKLPPTNKPFYFSLYSDGAVKTDVLTLYIAEPGDSVQINILSDSFFIVSKYSNKNYRYIKFIGKGAEKYTCRNNLDYDAQFDYQKKLLLLKTYDNSLSSFAYNLLMADIIGEQKCNELSILFSRTVSGLFSRDSLLNIIMRDSDLFPKKIMESSRGYSYYVVEKARILNLLITGGEQGTYDYLREHFKGELRDKLITIYITRYLSHIDNSIKIDAAKTVKTKYYFSILEKYNNALLRGRLAYNFSLPDTSGNMVNLSDFKGKVVFVDFWFTGCTGCRRYYQDVLSTVEAKYKDNSDLVFISISVDDNKKIWLNSINDVNGNSKYTSTGVINLFTEGKGAKHPIIYSYKVEGYPRPVLIDKSGRIFSTNENDLRFDGVDKLVQTINEVLLNYR